MCPHNWIKIQFKWQPSLTLWQVWFCVAEACSGKKTVMDLGVRDFPVRRLFTEFTLDKHAAGRQHHRTTQTHKESECTGPCVLTTGTDPVCSHTHTHTHTHTHWGGTVEVGCSLTSIFTDCRMYSVIRRPLYVPYLIPYSSHLLTRSHTHTHPDCICIHAASTHSNTHRKTLMCSQSSQWTLASDCCHWKQNFSTRWGPEFLFLVFFFSNSVNGFAW